MYIVVVVDCAQTLWSKPKVLPRWRLPRHLSVCEIQIKRDVI